MTLLLSFQLNESKSSRTKLYVVTIKKMLGLDLLTIDGAPGGRRRKSPEVDFRAQEVGEEVGSASSFQQHHLDRLLETGRLQLAEIDPAAIIAAVPIDPVDPWNMPPIRQSGHLLAKDIVYGQLHPASLVDGILDSR